MSFLDDDPEDFIDWNELSAAYFADVGDRLRDELIADGEFDER